MIIRRAILRSSARLNAQEKGQRLMSLASSVNYSVTHK
ncbi:hypothetical protein EPIB2_494 [Tritonibacter mobilis]|nr:hypothetical protein EPIB2_494 [Tritonibacter mobilis]